MRKKMKIILVIVVTIACIYSGFHTREKNGIVVTQIQTIEKKSLSYMLESSENRIVMIDGGGKEDSEHLEEILQAKGGVVEYWFITIANPENFGAMKQILENGNIQINQIYISFNEAGWYSEYYESEKYEEIAEFLDLIYSENIIKKVYNVPFRHQVVVDNLYFTVLNVSNPEFSDEYAICNQTMAIKVSNTYKSMIFMGNIAKEGAEKMKDNNLDEIDCDAVQISNNQLQMVDDKIYKQMTPKYLFMPTPNKIDQVSAQNEMQRLKEILKVEKSYLCSDGDVTVKIW